MIVIFSKKKVYKWVPRFVRHNENQLKKTHSGWSLTTTDENVEKVCVPVFETNSVPLKKL